MNNSLKLTGKIKYYLQWPLYMIVLWAAMVVVLTLRFGTEVGFVSAIFVLFYSLIILILYLKSTPGLMTEIPYSFIKEGIFSSPPIISTSSSETFSRST